MKPSARSMEMWLAVPFLACAASAQVTQRVSVNSAGVPGDGNSGNASISIDGRYVTFLSGSSNLDPGGAFSSGVFLRDRVAGTTERVSKSTGGAPAAGGYATSVSADGRFVAFDSAATNLVPGDTNLTFDVFVRDRQNGTTERVSVDSNGAEGNDASQYFASISADGRFVAFASEATNLVPGDTNDSRDIFVHDLQSGVTERVSVTNAGAEANDHNTFPSISADGRYVAFWSDASNLVAGDTNGDPDIFVRDRQNGTTERVSVDSSSAQVDGFVSDVAISADGRYAVFGSDSTQLVAGDTNAQIDIFVHDRQTGATERVSVSSSGSQAGDASYTPSISADGRYAAFVSRASDLVSGDTNGAYDVFVHDRQSGTTERVDVGWAGQESHADSLSGSISADGRFVSFHSLADNLVPADTNLVWDVFVHDREGGPDFSSACDPGVGGVHACPCGNPPGGGGRGCNNSSATGGAILSAAGGTYLSSDSLVFTTSGERPTPLSLVLQGDAFVPAGAVYGQGVRCVGGTFKRLYTKSASGGSITAPDLGAGDMPVSERSAALGSTILAGQSRGYLVFYRDPTVPGGCPASSTFNATQTGRVTWSP